MATTDVTGLSDSDPARKGINDPASVSEDPATLAGLRTSATALADTNPTTTAFAVSGGIGGGFGSGFGGNNGSSGNGFRGGNRGGNGNKNNEEKGLDPVAERALISVGSIGEHSSNWYAISLTIS
jgi:hypothetical protein